MGENPAPAGYASENMTDDIRELSAVVLRAFEYKTRMYSEFRKLYNTDLVMFPDEMFGKPSGKSPHNDYPGSPVGLVLSYISKTPATTPRHMRFHNHNGHLLRGVPPIEMTDNTIIAMYGPDFQKNYKHEILRRPVTTPGVTITFDARFS